MQRHFVILILVVALAVCVAAILVRLRKKPLGYALETTSSSTSTRPLISKLTEADHARLDQQRKVIADAIATLHPAVKLHGDHSDLLVLQELIDNRVFKPTQTYELQCLGVTFGDVLAKELGLHWAIITDEYGTDPTLQDGRSEITINALTMISKRIEEGREVNLASLVELNRAGLADLRKRAH